MKRSLMRRLPVAAIAGMAMCSLLTAAPAHATVPNGDVTVAAGGSDTTQNFMGDYLNTQVTNPANQNGATISVAGTSYNVHLYNIPAVPTGTYNVPGDSSCGDIAWDSTSATTPPKAPNGSTAGRNYLIAEQTAGAGSTPVGCMKIGRSSGAPRGAGNHELNFEYYAFAMDAVSWASTSLKAPATLTIDQLRRIYNCLLTNWNQVGGSDGPIQRYLAQVGSGTGDFFRQAVLGLSGSTTPPNPGGACPNWIAIEENEGTQVASTDIDKAILPFSAGRWVFQQNNHVNPTLDVRNGARLGGLTADNYASGTPTQVHGLPAEWNATDVDYQLNTSAGGVVNENNISIANPSFNGTTGYVGVRYVWNVVDTILPGYQPAAGLVGFNNTASPTFTSPLCSGSALTLIVSYGFAPLPRTGNPQNSNLAASRCRKFNGVA